jgi:hypothetical protein
MATRIPEPEPWCRVRAVLAEAAGVDESSSFDVAALAQAERMRGIRWDWAGRPTCTWSAAAELLASLRAEQARMVAEIEDKAVEAHQRFLANLPPGIPAAMVPDGVAAGLWAMLNDPDRERGRRQSVLEHSLENPAGATVYTSVNEGAS